MRIRTVLLAVVLLVALTEFSPALFFAETSVLMAESKINNVIGLDYFATLFGFDGS